MTRSAGRPRKDGNRAEERPRKRVPISVRNVLKWDDMEDGYHYRFVNDIENRIVQFKEAGYESIESPDVVGDQRSPGDPSPIATHVEKSVGGGIKGILMRIRDEWYEEDQREKQSEIDDVERSMDPRVREAQLREEGNLEEGQGGSGGWEGGILISR